MAKLASLRASSVATAIERYVRKRELVSIREGVQQIRNICPQCEHTEDELAELLAAAAIRSGCTVAFNSRGLPAREVSFFRDVPSIGAFH
jgi:hypothetical protein